MSSSLARFLHTAKLATYAAQGDFASVEPLLPSTKQLEFVQGDFLYRDIYAGMNFFVGQELVYHLERPVWSMAYSGGTVAEAAGAAVADIYEFLRSALRQCSPDMPVRGPGTLHAAEFSYVCDVRGSLERFAGIEQVTLAGSKVYELQFCGGFLR